MLLKSCINKKIEILLYTKLKGLCGIITVLFTLKLRNFILKEVQQIWLTLIIKSLFNSAIKYASKIWRVNFFTEALQITEQLKWCVMWLFKCFEGLDFSDGMLISVSPI